jgi:hypothetical protein
MEKLDDLTAEQILAINSPYHLFQTTTIEKPLRKLQQIWHPDRNHNPLATSVMSHINSLAERVENGDFGDVIIYTENTGSKTTYIFKYLKKVPIEIGTMYIGKRTVLFQVTNENQDLFDVAIRSMKELTYRSSDMERNFRRFVPREVQTFDADKGLFLKMYKGSAQISLGDLLESGFVFEPGHISWIVTGLYNFILFMQKIQNKMFGGLNLNGIFVNPEFRSVHFLDGWWFSQTLGKKIAALPSWVLPFISKKTLDDKVAVEEVDKVAIHCLALQLLGDSSMVGSKLLSTKKDAELVRFMRSKPHSDLISDYSNWLDIEKTISKSDITTTFSDLYNT